MLTRSGGARAVVRYASALRLWRLLRLHNSVVALYTARLQDSEASVKALRLVRACARARERC